MDSSVKRYKNRRAARLGLNTFYDYDSVEAYRKRREERLKARMDADGDDESTGGVAVSTKTGGKGHGNTKLPYGLCQREGIEVQPGWTPEDAWKALEGKGYSAKETYKELGKTGLVSKRGGTTARKRSFEDLSTEYAAMQQRWKDEDERRKEAETSAAEKKRKLNKLEKVKAEYNGETLEEAKRRFEEASKKMDDGDDSARKDFYKYNAMIDVMNVFGEDALKNDTTALREEVEKGLMDARLSVNHRERNEQRMATLNMMADAAREKYPNLTDCDSPAAFESRIRADDYFRPGDYTREMMDYTGMNTDSMRDIASSMDRIKQKFPKLAGKMPPPVMQDMEYGTYASVSFGDTLEINRRVFSGSYEDAVKSIKHDEKSGFHPKGCGSVGAMITHEYGHVVDQLLSKQFRGELTGGSFSTYVMTKLQKNHPGETPMSIMKQVSTYSWKNSNPTPYSEFVAEAFSEYVCSKKPRPIAKEVGCILEEYIGRM